MNYLKNDNKSVFVSFDSAIDLWKTLQESDGFEHPSLCSAKRISSSDWCEYQYDEWVNNILFNGDAEVETEMRSAVGSFEKTWGKQDMQEITAPDVCGTWIVPAVLMGIPDCARNTRKVETTVQNQITVIIGIDGHCGMSAKTIRKRVIEICKAVYVLEKNARVRMYVTLYSAINKRKPCVFGVKVKDYNDMIDYTALSALCNCTAFRKGGFRLYELSQGYFPMNTPYESGYGEMLFHTEYECLMENFVKDIDPDEKVLAVCTTEIIKSYTDILEKVH